MLKSLCIKTNNNRAINYLLDEFSNAKLNNLYISTSKFKLYNNFIIHYKGKELDTFYTIIADILSSLIINLYEENLIKRIISSNYFYFADIEQRKILDICKNYLYCGDLDEVSLRQDSLKISLIDYFANNKSVILDGFINFRINDYIKIIDYIVDLAVNKFVIDILTYYFFYVLVSHNFRHAFHSCRTILFNSLLQICKLFRLHPYNIAFLCRCYKVISFIFIFCQFLRYLDNINICCLIRRIGFFL